MKNSIMTRKNEYIFISLGIISIFLIWFIFSIIIDNEIVLPSISNVFEDLIYLLKDSKTYKIISFTLIRIVIALVIGIVLGIILGVLSAEFNFLYYIFTPMIKIMRALPIASIILIILIMFGMKGFNDITFSPIIVSILLVIPIVYEAVYKGIKNIDSNLIDVAKLDTSSRFDLIVNSYIPLIKNEISISFGQSIGLSFKSMVMAEYISQAPTSIGFALQNAKSWLEYNRVFSWTIILIILSIIFDELAKMIVREK